MVMAKFLNLSQPRFPYLSMETYLPGKAGVGINNNIKALAHTAHP